MRTSTSLTLQSPPKAACVMHSPTFLLPPMRAICAALFLSYAEQTLCLDSILVDRKSPFMLFCTSTLMQQVALGSITRCAPLSFLRSQNRKPFSQLGPCLSLPPVSRRLGNTDVTPEPANSTLVAGSILLMLGRLGPFGLRPFRCGATE